MALLEVEAFLRAGVLPALAIFGVFAVGWSWIKARRRRKTGEE